MLSSETDKSPASKRSLRLVRRVQFTARQVALAKNETKNKSKGKGKSEQRCL